MVKKSKLEIDIDLEALRKHIEETIPKFISPNGGSLEELQKKLLEIYGLLSLIINSLKSSAWDKQ